MKITLTDCIILIVAGFILGLSGCGGGMLHQVRTVTTDKAGTVTVTTDVSVIAQHTFSDPEFGSADFSASPDGSGAASIKGFKSKTDIGDLMALARLLMAASAVATVPTPAPVVAPPAAIAAHP